MPRLDKLLADRTTLGRKLARTRVRQGRVRLGDADGSTEAPSRDPGLSVPEDTWLYLDRQPLPPRPQLAVLYKPVGVVSTTSDPHGRACLADVARDLLDLGLHPVGRLDADTDGLLPFSRDGALTQHLLHPRHGVQKVYRARVEGAIPADLADRLAAGVKTAEGVHTAVLRSVDGDVVELAVTEGKHRMVRRMLANLGLPVIALRRLAFGPFELGDLEPGSWRPARPDELLWLHDRLSG